MTPWRFAARNFVRGLRAGRLTVLMIALTVAVMAITSVGFFIDRVRASVAQEAAGMLAADLRLRASDPLDPDYLAQAAQRGLRTAQSTSFATVIVAGDASQLASLHAVSDAYPLRGQVRLADAVGAASYGVTGAPPAGRAWLEEGLLARLGAAVGGTVTIGAREFTVERVLRHRPDQSLGFDTFAPSLMINLSDLESTELIQPGSRATWAQLFAGETADVAAFSEWFATSGEADRRLQTAGRSEERISVTIERAESFLSLASMIALLLAATAVAVSARRYAAEQIDGVALMKCLGASQALVLTATLIELGIIGVTTGIAGSALGYLAQFGLGSLVGELMELELPAPSLAPGVSGILAALAVLAGFALPAMLSLRSVPPLRVLRHDAEPRAVPTAVSYGMAAAAVLGLLVWLVGTSETLVVSVIGLGVGAVVLYVAALGLVRLVGPLRSGAGVAWRYGLANIARRRADSVAQVMAFGFGLTVLLLLSGVRTGLLDTWYTSLPTDAPNHFMINIQREEVDGIRALFAEHDQQAPALVPMVRGRLIAIDGEELARRRTRGEGGWLMREANLTWAEELDATNELVAGEWWTPATDRAEISVEEGIMEGLGLELGAEMTFEIDGIGHERAARRMGLAVAELHACLESPRTRRFSGDFRRLGLRTEPRGHARSVATLPERHGRRPRVRTRAGPQRHGPRRARHSVRISVHAARGHRRATRHRAGDARGAALRSGVAAHTRRESPARARLARHRVRGSGRPRGSARVPDRLGRRLSARDARVRPSVHARSARHWHRPGRGRRDRRLERYARDVLGRAPVARGCARAGELGEKAPANSAGWRYADTAASARVSNAACAPPGR
jgi:putative ABC transport system permease protein